MEFRFKTVPLLFLVLVVLNCHAKSEPERESLTESLPRFRSAPVKNIEGSVIDGTGIADTLRLDDTAGREPGKDGGRVSVTTVALFTLAMAAATGLGAVPFFFVELDPQWEGICNGMAAGVMIAASFDLIQEGHQHGGSNWVVIGILAGGVFIWLCKKVVPLNLSFMLLLIFYVFKCCPNVAVAAYFSLLEQILMPIFSRELPSYRHIAFPISSILSDSKRLKFHRSTIKRSF